MLVLVTGGAGFVGTNLVEYLLRRGHDVQVLDDLSAGARPSWWGSRSGPRCIRASVEDEAAIRRAARGVEVIVHLAARPGVPYSVAHPELDFRTNVVGTFTVVDAARRARVSSLVFASSGAVLAGARPPLREDLAPAPLSPYGASKLYGEGITAAAGIFGIVGVSLRFANVYGPNSAHKNSVIALFIRRALARQPLVIFGSGRQTRDFLYVDDVCSAIEGAMRVARPGLYQVGTGIETSINALATKVADACGVPRRVQRRDPRPGDAARSFVDLSAARRRLGWSPKVSLEGGLTETVRWVQSETKWAGLPAGFPA